MDVLMASLYAFHLIAVGNTCVETPATNDDLIKTCVDNILLRHFEPNYLIVALNISFTSDYPMVRLVLHDEVDLILFPRVNIYIISASENLEEILRYLSDFHNFNPRAKFILIWNQAVSEDIFRFASTFYISHVVVVEHFSQNLFTYFPYDSRNVQDPNTTSVPLGACLQNYQNANLFGKKMPDTWDNSVVRVSYKPFAPYVVDPDGTLKGMEIFTIETIKKYFKFETEYYLNNGRYYDDTEPETYFECYGTTMSHETDISVGAFYLIKLEHLDFDVSHAYLQDSFFWVVPKARILEQWQRIIYVFRYKIWISFCCSLVLFSVVYITWLRFRKVPCSSIIPLYLFGVLVEYPASVPQKYIIRGLFGTWIFYCLIISTAFKSQMMNILSGVAYAKELATLQEIVDSDLIISLPQEYANLYDCDGFPLDKYVYEHNVRCDDYLECPRRTATKRDTASIAMGRYIDYLMPQFLDDYGRQMVTVLQEQVYPMSIHMIVSKGFPIFEQMNDLLMLLEANGIVEYNYDYMADISKARVMTKMRLAQEDIVNDLEAMALPFVLLGYGYTTSAILLCLELLWSKLKKNKTFRSHKHNLALLATSHKKKH